MLSFSEILSFANGDDVRDQESFVKTPGLKVLPMYLIQVYKVSAFLKLHILY